MTVGGFRFEIPFEEWWLASDNRPCVQTTPPAFMGVLLGDVFFRALVVQFDLTHPTIPVRLNTTNTARHAECSAHKDGLARSPIQRLDSRAPLQSSKGVTMLINPQRRPMRLLA